MARQVISVNKSLFRLDGLKLADLFTILYLQVAVSGHCTPAVQPIDTHPHAHTGTRTETSKISIEKKLKLVCHRLFIMSILQKATIRDCMYRYS